MIEVIENKEKWDELISLFEKSDLYHTFDYHHITKDDGKPVLLKYCDDDICIALPLLIRKIPNSSFYDATSVYGYPGPLSKNLPESFDTSSFSKCLHQYFADSNIVSVFSRLNPFISNQQKVLNGIGMVQRKGSIVSIDLKKDVNQQRREFSNRLKGQLNKSRRYCTVKKAVDDAEYHDFIKIYHENMDRVNAQEMYYFDDYYFKVLAKSESFNTETLLAIDNESGQTVGASMFIYKNAVIHYHLSGTRGDSLHMMPTKLLIDEMRLKASQLGLSHFNLGGGLGSADDSLLRFKSSFSKNLMDFHVWKLIVLPDVYKTLTYGVHRSGEVDFFPSYRFKKT